MKNHILRNQRASISLSCSDHSNSQICRHFFDPPEGSDGNFGPRILNFHSKAQQLQTQNWYQPSSRCVFVFCLKQQKKAQELLLEKNPRVLGWVLFLLPPPKKSPFPNQEAHNPFLGNSRRRSCFTLPFWEEVWEMKV